MTTHKNPLTGLPVTDRHSPYFTNMGGGEQEVIDVTDLAPQRKTPRTVDELIDQVFEDVRDLELQENPNRVMDFPDLSRTRCPPNMRMILRMCAEMIRRTAMHKQLIEMYRPEDRP